MVTLNCYTAEIELIKSKLTVWYDAVPSIGMPLLRFNPLGFERKLRKYFL